MIEIFIHCTAQKQDLGVLSDWSKLTLNRFAPDGGMGGEME